MTKVDALMQAIKHLQHVYTDDGVITWLVTLRYQLGGLSPLQYLNLPGADLEKFIELAEGSRSSDAT